MIKSITVKLSLLFLLIAITTCYYERDINEELQICYTKSNNIWIMDMDGSNQSQITDSNNDVCPSWSPDGKRIVYQNNSSYPSQIFIINTDGTNLIQFTKPISNETNEIPTWSSDGEYIIFSKLIFTTGYLFIAKPDGTILKKIQTGNLSSSKTMSIDGRFVYYSKMTHFCRMDLSTGTEENYGSSLSYYADYVSISPDGRYVLCSYNGDIFIYEIITQSTTNLASGSDPCWTPDGKTIIYTNGSNIYRINIDLTNNKQLTFTNDCSSPCVKWKPK